MGTADILIISFLLFFAIRGVIRGFVVEVIGLLGLVLAFLCSFMIYTPMFKLATMTGLTGNAASVTAYIAGFLLIYVVVILLGRFVHKALTIIQLGWLNRLIGFLFGGLKGGAIASLILWGIFYALPNDAQVIKDINNSKTAITVMKIAPYIYSKIDNIAGVDRVNPFK